VRKHPRAVANLSGQVDMEQSTCSVWGCGRSVRCKQRCRRHYDQWLRATPQEQRQAPTLRERILAKVVIDENGCWIWQGHIGPKGYGQVRGLGGTRPAHQSAYEQWKGPLPKGTEPDHLCKVRSCVNPDHLEAVSHHENLHRGDTLTARNAAKTHCPQRHPYAGDNLIIRICRNGTLGRVCRTCRDEKNRARYR
jgi:hypothetical protein